LAFYLWSIFFIGVQPEDTGEGGGGGTARDFQAFWTTVSEGGGAIK